MILSELIEEASINQHLPSFLKLIKIQNLSLTSFLGKKKKLTLNGTHRFQITLIDRVIEFPNFKAAYRDFTDKKHSMAFFSEKLKETKKKYSTYELSFMQWCKQFKIGSIIIVMESLFKEEIFYI